MHERKELRIGLSGGKKKLKARKDTPHPDVDGRVILKWSLKG